MSLDHATPAVVNHSSLVGRLRRDHVAATGAVTIAVAALAAAFVPVLAGLSGNDPFAYDLGALDATGAPAGWGGGISAAH